jgi:glycosyltransferase involved in cell wall biosynthesis
MEKVSVIIPMYNYGCYLRDAIDSVLEQSVKAHEIICVSDGAIDNSVEIVKEFQVKHPEIILIEKTNGGLASARNAGVRASTGKYFMSFDSDDIMKPDCLKEHLKLADEKSIVTCGLMAFGDETYTAVPTKATVSILLQTNVIYSNTLFPKKAWEEVGGYDESPIMRLGWEDREFNLRVVGAGYESKTSTYVALLWRRHGNTMSSTSADPNHIKLQEYIYNKNKHLI